MHPHNTAASIPTDTARMAKAILGQNNLYRTVGDNWQTFLAGRFSKENSRSEASNGRMALAPTLTLITFLQYHEKLSDRQAEEASRLRVEWKYALHLPVYYPGVARTLLCQYRQQVIHDPARQQEFQAMLDRFTKRGLFFDCQEPSPSAEVVLDEVCTRSRLDEVLLPLRRALEVLATTRLNWLRDNILPDWYARYQVFKPAPDLPQDFAGQVALTEVIGNDILHLFSAIDRSDLPELAELEEIIALRQTWREQFELNDDGSPRRLARCSFCGLPDTASEKGE